MKAPRDSGDAAGWVNPLAYADDLLWLAKPEKELESMYKDLRAACDRFGFGFRAD